MLKLSPTFTNVPVLSLRTGRPIATANKIIFNPNNLKIEGWKVTDSHDNSQLMLVSGDVREVIDKGIVVNDHEVLSPESDLVRLQPIIELQFELLGKIVVTESGKKLGKITDFAVETQSLFVKKIYASQSIVKNFAGGTLSIDRTQIVEITNKKIIVDDSAQPIKGGVPAPSLAS